MVVGCHTHSSSIGADVLEIDELRLQALVPSTHLADRPDELGIGRCVDQGDEAGLSAPGLEGSTKSYGRAGVEQGS